MLFVPGYDRGHTPYGRWTVTHAYADPGWISSQDSRDDFAILQLAHQRYGSRLVGVQDVAGANLLLPRLAATQSITDVAYNSGIDDRPISCTTSVYFTAGFPSFNCHGYVGGSSGSPWLMPVPGTHITLVRGVIGGLHHGGCHEYTSYSAPLDADIYRLLLRAMISRHPDTLPKAASDGC